MSKPTPGPWQVVDGSFPSFIEVRGPSFRLPICIFASDITLAESMQRHADAHLIAAAPELYAAAKLLEDLMTNWAGDFRIEAKDMVPTMLAGEMIAKFKAAIASAEGRPLQESESEPATQYLPERKSQ
jgi:hypothetical protein